MRQEVTAIERIVDDLYAGILDAEAWERGLRSTARLVGGQGPFLLAFNPTTAAVLRDQIFDYDPAVFQAFREQWSAKDIRLPAALAVPVGKAMTERSLLPNGEWERCEAYNDFFRVNDAPWLVTAWLHKSPDKVALFSVQATRSRGPFDAREVALIERIVPHVRRALAIKDRLESGAAHSQSLLQALEHVPFGVMLLDAAGRVLDASSAAVDSLAEAAALGREAGGQFTFKGAAGRALHGLLGSAMHHGSLSDGQVHLQRGAGRPPLALLLAPLPDQLVPWFFGAPRWLLFVFDPERGIDAAAERIRCDLGISAREAELASLLSAGLNVEAAATRLGISVGTARQHLKSIYSKTGISSQAQLVRRVLTGPASTR